MKTSIGRVSTSLSAREESSNTASRSKDSRDSRIGLSWDHLSGLMEDCGGSCTGVASRGIDGIGAAKSAGSEGFDTDVGGGAAELESLRGDKTNGGRAERLIKGSVCS